MRITCWTWIALALSLLAARGEGQIQSNSSMATLRVNGVSQRGFNSSFPVLVSDFDNLIGEVVGQPNRAFLLGLDVPTPATNLPPLGILHLSLTGYLPIVNGFNPFGSFTTGPGGTWSAAFSATALPTGIELTVQAAVDSSAGILLTAPCNLMRVPGEPLPFVATPWSIHPQTYSAGNRHAVVADFNGDGRSDYANSSGVYLGTATPPHLAFQSLDPPGIEMAVADMVPTVGASPGTFPQDLDMVAMNNATLCIQIFRGNGTGFFYQNSGTGSMPAAPAIIIPTLCTDDGIVLARDLDNDGDVDLVAANGGTLTCAGAGVSPGIRFFENLGNGGSASQFANATFAAATPTCPQLMTTPAGCPTTFPSTGPSLFNPGESRAAAVADFNGDGAPDLICDGGAVFGIHQTWLVLGNPAAPSVAALAAGATVPIPGLPGNGCRWLSARDMDGDGDQDVLWAGDTAAGVLFNNGSGTFTFAPLSGFVPQSNFPLVRLEAWDADGDGLLDVCYTDRSGNRSYVVVHWHQPLGAFTFRWFLPIPASTTSTRPGHAIAAAIAGTAGQDLVIGGSPATVLVR